MGTMRSHRRESKACKPFLPGYHDLELTAVDLAVVDAGVAQG
jgi:hypothetical protein